MGNILGTPSFKNALLTAAEKGQSKIVGQILEAGAHVNVEDSSGHAPLDIASRRGHIEVVRVLLENNAGEYIFLNTYSFCTVRCRSLYYASCNGHVQIVKLLLKNGASTRYRNTERWTSLHRASRNGHIKIVALLLMSVTYVDIKDSSGRTPLALALQYGHAEVVKILLKNGANLFIKDNDELHPRVRKIIKKCKKINNKMYKLKEWRPWNHHNYPFPYRGVMTILAILAKAYYK